MIEKIEYTHRAELKRKTIFKWNSSKHIYKYVPFVTKKARIFNTIIIEICRVTAL